MKIRIAVLLTCHNRRQITLACLDALFASHLPQDASFQVYLIDDGSVDGTGEAVRRQFPSAQVIEGDGNLYWNGGMRLAFSHAMRADYDYYLWLNDDTFLYPDTLSTLVEVAEGARRKENKSVIVVGSTQSEPDGKVNHGGIVKWQKLNSELVIPSNTPVPCETMYGNCVLIPSGVVQAVGNLDGAFVHSIGDVDYGLRATKAGFKIFVMPGFAGTCSLNPVAGSISDAALSLRLRYRKLLSPTGLPIKSFSTFLWRHYGLRGVLYGIWVYLSVMVTWLRARIKAV